MEIFKEFTLETATGSQGSEGTQVSPAPWPLLPRGGPRAWGGRYDTGWVMDSADFKAAFQPVHDQLHHQYLNGIERLENPTSENLARWIWRRLQHGLPTFSKLIVRETCTSGCIYRGEDSPKERRITPLAPGE